MEKFNLRKKLKPEVKKIDSTLGHILRVQIIETVRRLYRCSTMPFVTGNERWDVDKIYFGLTFFSFF